MFSIVIVSIYIPANSARGFPFFTSSPAFTVCRFFNDGHSNQCEVIPHCSFDLHFSNKTCVFVCVCVCVYVCVSCSVVSDSCDPMDYSLSGSSVHGIIQSRTLEW